MANLTRKFKNPLWNISKSKENIVPVDIRKAIAKRENMTDNVANMVHKETVATARKIASAAIAIIATTKIKNSILTTNTILSPPYFTYLCRSS